MDVNTIISVFMFSLIFLLGVLGLIYSMRNNNSIKKVLEKEKVIGGFHNLKIRDFEALGVSFWHGNMIIYENYILIEKVGFFHLIVKNQNAPIAKKVMTISFNRCYLNRKNNLIIQGTKHRLLMDGAIKMRISSDSIHDLERISNLLNNKPKV